MTLRWRLTLLYVGATTLVFLVALGSFRAVYRFGQSSATDRELIQAADEVTDLVEAESLKGTSALRQGLARFTEEKDALFIRVSDPEGHLLYQSDPDLPLIDAAFPPVKGTDHAPFFSTVRLPNKRHLRVTSLALPPPTHRRVDIGTLLPVSQDLFSGRQGYAVFLFCIAFLGAIGWTGWLMAGRALRPMGRITEVAQAVSQGALEERIPSPGTPDEVGRLIDVLNQMLGRIEAATKKLQQFCSNVSHQLKTPLTVLRGEIEVALRGRSFPQEIEDLLKSTLAELEGLSNLVEDLLAYARTDNGRPLTVQAQRLDLFVQNVVKKAEVLCRSKKQHLDVELEPVTALFHPGRLEQALLNVLDNAVKHTPSEGNISLHVKVDGDQALIKVQDSGPGVSREELAHVFDRGRSRSSTGIGLGLARNLVESFCGAFEVTSEGGQGLAASIRIPMEVLYDEKR